jgi:hypothetical protein
MEKKRKDFPQKIKRIVLKRADNRCERCGVDFDEKFQGEFHHIIPVVYGGSNSEENCSLLCRNCHLVAPNIKHKEDMIIYRYYFLRFASFKEAAQYYGVESRFEVYFKIAMDIAKVLKISS